MKEGNAIAGAALIVAIISLIAVVVMMFALRDNVVNNTASGDEMLVPAEQTSESEARHIAMEKHPGELIDSEITRSKGDIRGRGFAELAWEVQIQRPNSDFVDLVYVALSDGAILRSEAVSVNKFVDDEFLVPPEDALEDAKVNNRMVHCKAQGGFGELCWELHVARPNSEFTDLIFVAKDDGEVIRTDTVPTKSLN